MDEEDALYGLPLEQFITERDALAKRLRAAGDREASARVKGLRKPTVAAWAVNQVARTQRAALREIDEAGAALRKTHAALLRGKAGGKELRSASERERAAVDVLATAARGLLSTGGRDLSESVLQDVRESLHAMAGDEATREAVLAGRLDRERHAAGLGGELGVAASAPKTAGRANEKASAQAGKVAAGRVGARAARTKAKGDSKRAKEKAAAKAAASAKKAADAKEAAAAEKAADEARRAEREHADARERLEAAEAALKSAKLARDEAREAERTARRVRDRAAKQVS